jgi:hypothetical protein
MSAANPDPAHSKPGDPNRTTTSDQPQATDSISVQFRANRTQIWAVGSGLLLLAAFGFAVWSVFSYFAGKAPNLLVYSGPSVETQFNRDVATAIGPSSPLLAASAFTDEWPAARSDHKIVAYMIARCRGIPIDTMSRQQFSALLLDLRPDGSHSWVDDNEPKPTDGGQTQTSTTYQLEPFDQAVLAISDSVARARLAAVRGADKFFPDVIKFGWAAVIISALATMFVTLKSSLSPNPSSKEGTFGWHWHKFWIFAFGFLAITLSAATTILASAKQFWDPTAAYMRNESALVSLRQLHEQIVLDFVLNVDNTCRPVDGKDRDAKLVRWVTTLVSLQPGTLAAPVLIPVANNSPPTPPQGSDLGTERREPNAPNRPPGQPLPSEQH